MKVENAKSEFQPVTITLQSQEELDIFTEVFYVVGGYRFRDVFGNTSTVVEMLRSKGGVSGAMNVSGEIRID